MINLEPDPATPNAAPPAFDWMDVEWTAADFKRARAVLAEVEEITVSLMGRWMSNGSQKSRRRAWFKKATGQAADVADAISELDRRIDELMRLKQMGGHFG